MENEKEMSVSSEVKRTKKAPRHAMAVFILGSVVVVIGFLAILLHELAGWLTPGQALLIMFGSIMIGITLWLVARKLGMPT